MAIKLDYRGSVYRKDDALFPWLAQRPTEKALEPELPIIDPHHHFWQNQVRGTYLFPELLADLGGGHNIIATVFLECGAMYRADGPEEMKPVGEVEFVNGFAAMSASGNYGKTRIAAGIVGYADLMLGAPVRAVLEAEIAAAPARYRGIRYIVSREEDESIMKYALHKPPAHILLDARFREGFAQLEKLGLSFDSWQYHTQIPEVTDLARAFPGTTIVLNHIGGVLGVGPYAARRAEVMETWRKDITELAKSPNVYCKIGGLGMTHFGFGFPEMDKPASSEELAKAWKPYIETCIEVFGANRCMFESNFPPDKQSCGYSEVWNAFKRVAASASALEKTALFSGTAAKAYRLAV